MASNSIPNALQELYDGLQDIVRDIARAADAAGTPRVELSRPADEKFGDFASNVALMLAPLLQRNPREVAQEIAARIGDLPGVSQVDVAGPGFVNVTLDDAWFAETLASVLTAGDAYGRDV